MTNKLFTLLLSFVLVSVMISSPLLTVDANTFDENLPTGFEISNVSAIEEINPHYTIEHLTLDGGIEVSAHIVNGPPHPPEGFEVERAASMIPLTGATALPDFPSYSWVFGCGAVAGGMITAYYDRNGYPNMYAGPTNGGMMPLTDTAWPTWVDSAGEEYPNNPLIASHKGVDERTTYGSIDNYWVSFNSTEDDPYITYERPQHTWDSAIGDYMKTSQSYYGNSDGSSALYFNQNKPDRYTCSAMESHQSESGDWKVSEHDSTYGRKLFYEARGYTVTDCYNQATDNKVADGFSFSDFKAEIDAGHPVFVFVTGHFMVGYGYSGDDILIRDTWDNNPSNTYSMPWGGSYQDMEMRAVGIVRPVPPGNLAPTNIYLSSSSVQEGQPVNTVVGILSTADPNLGDTHTYTLVSGDGSADNAAFNISGNQLRTSQVFSKADKDSYKIRVRSTDQGDLWFEKMFTITVTDASAEGQTYLPLILTAGETTSRSLMNGDFEAGPDESWTEQSSHGEPIITEFEPGAAHSDVWAAWMGGLHNSVDRLSQTVTISASQPNLHFWYWISSDDVCGFDYAHIKFNSTTIKTFNLCTANNTGAWKPAVLNLSAYSGSTATLVFEVTTNASLLSSFYLDDVSLSSSATAASTDTTQGTPLIDMIRDKRQWEGLQ